MNLERKIAQFYCKIKFCLSAPRKHNLSFFSTIDWSNCFLVADTNADSSIYLNLREVILWNRRCSMQKSHKIAILKRENISNVYDFILCKDYFLKFEFWRQKCLFRHARIFFKNLVTSFI